MDALPSLTEIDAAAEIVYRHLQPTPQYAWPLLEQQLGTSVWVKHENHTPVGAFKIRGGLVYFEVLRAREPQCRGVISATRGNHGQSVGFAARRHGLSATIVVPQGNSREKNAAMQALGVDLIEWGDDFQEAREHAAQLAVERDLHMIPAFHPDLVLGVATYWTELLRAVPDLDLLFVPIGQGSGICAAVAAREALGHSARIIGVVSSHAEAYALSFEQRRPCIAPATTRVADGMACRVPDQVALEVIWKHVDEILRVSDEEVLGAMKACYVATHNVAEGAGAAALAGALQIRGRIQGKRIGLTLSGGNVDRQVFAEAIMG
uniref:Threonine ammonia-lyase n=1 Tax=mine drainage metagenome TaxID=410659 RepID=E6PPA4_9ZZZZ